MNCWLIRVFKLSFGKQCCHALSSLQNTVLATPKILLLYLNWFWVVHLLRRHLQYWEEGQAVEELSSTDAQTWQDWGGNSFFIWKRMSKELWIPVISYFPVWLSAPHILPASRHKTSKKGNICVFLPKAKVTFSWPGVGEKGRQRTMDCETSCHGSRLWHQGEAANQTNQMSFWATFHIRWWISGARFRRPDPWLCKDMLLGLTSSMVKINGMMH